MNGVLPDPRVPIRAHVALAVSQLGFGLFPVFGKLVFPPRGPIPPLGVAALRAAFGAVSLQLLASAVRSKGVEQRGDYLRLAVYAFFGIVLNQILYLQGLAHSSATHAGLLVAATPAIAYGLAIAIGRETARIQPTMGVVLAIVGAAWIALVRPTTPNPDATLFGDALLLANVACYAVYLVLVRDVLGRVDPLRAIAWIFTFGAVANVPVGLPALHEVDWNAVPARTWWHLAFILLCPTSICYALNAWALKRAPATLAAVYTSTQPVIATISAALVLGERPPVVDTSCAALLILAGVMLVALRRVGSTP
ncbi:MAG: DMT family transporter [Planctomycetota bacterium]